MSRFQIDYHRQRAAAERCMAAMAERQDVAAIHEELARLHQALVDEDELHASSYNVVPMLRSA